MTMRNGLAVLGLALITAVSSPAQAQGSEAESHVLSAFTTGADPGVFAENVNIGPVLRAEVGADPAKAYDAIIDRTTGKLLRVRLLAPAEAARYATLPGVNAGDPLVVLESGDLQLLMQYAPKEKHVAFVEQVSAPLARTAPPPVRVEGPRPPAEAPKPAAAPTPPPVAPAPAVTPPAPPVAPAPVATPSPPRVATPAPSSAPAPRIAAPAAAAAPAKTAKPRPRGECVIKPVMSEEDLWNCSAPARPAATAAPATATPAAVPAAAAASAPATPAAPKPRPECVIKPVMTEEDLRNCAAVSKSSSPSVPAAASAVAAPAQTAPAPASPPRAKPECVIKPVMTEEDLRNCAAVSRSAAPSSAPAAASAAPIPAPSTPAAAPASPPRARTECVIKPVMSEEDLRACGVRR